MHIVIQECSLFAQNCGFHNHPRNRCHIPE